MGLLSFLNRKDGPLELSKIRSKKLLEQALKTGELVTVYLTPLVFGGAEDDSNAVYAPPAAAKMKERCDDMAEKLFVKGDVNYYAATPHYKGKSLVPSSIKIKVGGDTSFEQTIQIWQ